MLQYLKDLSYIRLNIKKQWLPQLTTVNDKQKLWTDQKDFSEIFWKSADSLTMFVHPYNTTLDFLEHEYPDFIPFVPEVFFDDPPVSG